VPPQVTAEDVVEEGWDARLVTLNAWLVDPILGMTDQRLVLRAGNVRFNARLVGGCRS
jgi:hypothetical protein